MSDPSAFTRDVFICHRSTEKASVVRPLVKHFDENGISSWVDEAEIRWGESLTAKVNEGLRISRFVVVVLSTSFVDQHWPERELNSALNIEASSGETKVLPLLLGSDQERQKILQHYPLLNDKKYMRWPADKDLLVGDVEVLLGRLPTSKSESEVRKASRRTIPTPNILRQPSELDRHKFARRGYKIVREYFGEGVDLIVDGNPDVDADIEDIHKYKFICNIFVNGSRVTKCKIWLGGMTGDDQISYSTSFDRVDSDNSYNDWLTVSREQLAWEPSGTSRWDRDAAKGMNHEDAAQYLWSQFIEPLERR